ncbi:ATP-binding protein [Cognatishimia activa]|uniref:histidine kinase n=1 Tax=Cognatishimia activa TaxID=1715691 RepID=A0A0N7MB98_9RHOB|nr:ATP-binding protein [Cognatishimia activa]CUI32427.1 Signal transduction histidine-protein kinase BarA [Cognatishimia activa]CUK24808.1 Signal transduction histidine-protein kinase BarA [Cognatishimia activa]
MSITRQIALSAALLGLVSGLVLGGWSLRNDAAQSRAQALDTSERFIAATVPQIASAYWEVDIDRVSSLLDGLLEDPIIQSARIEDPIMTEQLRQTAGFGELNSVTDAVPPSFSSFDRILGFSGEALERRHILPSPRDGRNLGELVLQMNFDAARLEMRTRSALTLALSILQSLLVAAAVFVVVQWRVIRPLGQLQTAALRVREGESFELQPPWNRMLDRKYRDEISRLARGFQRSVDDLEQSRNTLQENVALRTQELEIARNDAVRASEAKSDFLANISHELRTPLNAILGIADILMEGNATGQQKQYLSDMRNAASQLADNISSVLDLSRIEAQEDQPELSDASLFKILDDVVSQLRSLTIGRPIKLSCRFDPDLPEHIETDRIRLRQILVNLASNAAKYTEEGHIRFEVALDANVPALVFHVHDTGDGIAEDKLDEIFRPFGQIDGSSTRIHGGTGLGLAIADGLAKSLGAGISVESTLGEGSTFSLTLPITQTVHRTTEYDSPLRLSISGTDGAVDQLQSLSALLGHQVVPKESSDVDISETKAEVTFSGPETTLTNVLPVTIAEFGMAVRRCSERERDRAEVHADLRGMRVAIVEDNPVNSNVFQQIFTTAGAVAEPYDSGQAALDGLTTSSPPDLILLDLHMPRMDGRQTLAKLRAHFGKDMPPVVAATADAMPETRELCQALGFDGFLAKPIEPDVLRDVAKEMVARRRPAIIDREKGLLYSDGSTRLYLQTLSKLQASLPIHIETLENETGEASEVLHVIKGVTATVGADPVGTALANAKQTGDRTTLYQTLADLMAELNAIEDPLA